MKTLVAAAALSLALTMPAGADSGDISSDHVLPPGWDERRAPDAHKYFVGGVEVEGRRIATDDDLLVETWERVKPEPGDD